MILINTLEVTLTLFLAYVVVVTVSGYFSALITTSFGDKTAEFAGLLTPNPIAHIDPIGVILLMVFGFGWGKNVPVNPFFINPPYERLKIIIAYYANTIMQIFIAFFSLMLLLIFFDVKIIEQVQPMLLPGGVYISKMLFTGEISLPHIAYFYPDYASFTLVVGSILVAVVYLASLLAVIDFLLNSFRLFLHFFTNVQMHDDFLLFIIPMLIICFLFVGPVRVEFMIKIVQIARFFDGALLPFKHLIGL